MKLSSRMEAVAAMVSPCRVLADIGTDHAYVPIALVERGIADAAIAMDVREGPLARARENIASAGMTERMEVRLSDGTAALAPGEADVVLIAGMGGALMRRILQDGREVMHTARELVLQPQSEIAEFRRFLWDEGYRILDENMVYEDGKYYTIIKAAWNENTGEENSILTNIPEEMKQILMAEDEMPDREDGIGLLAEYGSYLLARKHPVLLEFLRKEQKELQKILASLSLGNAPEGRWENKTEYIECSMDANDRIAKRRMELSEKLRRNQLAQQLFI